MVICLRSFAAEICFDLSFKFLRGILSYLVSAFCTALCATLPLQLVSAVADLYLHGGGGGDEEDEFYKHNSR
jgi:hypothetical protein